MQVQVVDPYMPPVSWRRSRVPVLVPYSAKAPVRLRQYNAVVPACNTWTGTCTAEMGMDGGCDVMPYGLTCPLMKPLPDSFHAHNE